MTTVDNGVTTYISLATEEYKTLRAESIQASVNMWTAMQWGSALIGVTIGIGLSQWNVTNPATPLAFDIVVPTFAALMMAFWLGEAARFKRVGDYLCLVEQKLSLVFESNGLVPGVLRTSWPDIQRKAERALNLRSSDSASAGELIISDPVSWEQWLRARKGRSVIDGHLSILYAVRLGFFLVLAWGSWLAGLFYAYTAPSILASAAHITILALGAIVCCAASAGALIVRGYLNQTTAPIERNSKTQ